MHHAPLQPHSVPCYAPLCPALCQALYLSAVGLSPDRIGLLLYITLVGDACISLLVTLFADRMGRRRMLLLGCALKVRYVKLWTAPRLLSSDQHLYVEPPCVEPAGWLLCPITLTVLPKLKRPS